MYTVYYIFNKHKTAGTKQWHNIGSVLSLFTIPSYPLFNIKLWTKICSIPGFYKF